MQRGSVVCARADLAARRTANESRRENNGASVGLPGRCVVGRRRRRFMQMRCGAAMASHGADQVSPRARRPHTHTQTFSRPIGPIDDAGLARFGRGSGAGLGLPRPALGGTAGAGLARDGSHPSAVGLLFDHPWGAATLHHPTLGPSSKPRVFSDPPLRGVLFCLPR